MERTRSVYPSPSTRKGTYERLLTEPFETQGQRQLRQQRKEIAALRSENEVLWTALGAVLQPRERIGFRD